MGKNLEKKKRVWVLNDTGSPQPHCPPPPGIAYLQTSCYMAISVIKWTPESDYNGSEPHSATEKHM